MFSSQNRTSDGGILKSTNGSQEGCGNSGIVCEFVTLRMLSSPDSRMTTRVSAPASLAISCSSWPSRGAALGVAAFLDLFDNLGTEGFQVAPGCGRDDALVYNDLGVFPFAPAFATSVLIDLKDVILRPLAMPVSISSHGAWHTAATTFWLRRCPLINFRAFGSTLSKSGLIWPPGNTTAS